MRFKISVSDILQLAMNIFLSKKIIIPAAMFFGGLFIVSGILMSVNFTAAKLSITSQSSEWTQAAGTGISVPACASASNQLPTCFGSGSSVQIDWSYSGTHGACTDAIINFNSQRMWATKTTGAPGNAGFAYGVINGKFYYARGTWNVNGYYDPVTNTHNPITPPVGPSSQPASAVVGTKLYAFTSVTEIYDQATNSWSSGTPPPQDVTWGGAAAIGTDIYIASNAGGGNTLLRYDTVANNFSWTNPGGYSRVSMRPAVAALGTKIYIIGSNTTSGAVDVFDTVTNSWSQAANFPGTAGVVGNGYAAAVSYDGTIYVFGGGRWGFLGGTNEAWQYYPSSDEWVRRTNMPYGADALGAGVVNNRIYVYGGVTDNYSGETYEYDPTLDTEPTYVDTSPLGLSCSGPSTYTWTGGSSNTTYNYAVSILSGATVIDTSNAGSFTTPGCFDFSLTNGGDKSVAQGESVTNSITATLSFGATQSVSFSTSGLPSGATASFSPTNCDPTCSTVMTINTLGSTPTGSYDIVVNGTVFGGAAYKKMDQNIATISETVNDSFEKIQRIFSTFNF